MSEAWEGISVAAPPGGWGPPGGAPPPGGWGPPGGAPPPGPPGSGWTPPPWEPPGGGYPPGGAGHGGYPAPGAAPTFTPTEAMTFAWERVKADPGTIVGTLVVAFISMWVATLLGGAITNLMGLAGGSTVPRFPATGAFDLFAPAQLAVMGVVQLVNIVVYSYMMTGITRFALNVSRGAPYGFGDLFTGGATFASVMIANTLSGIGVAIGTLLLVVPGIIVTLGTSMATPLIVDRGLGPIEALTSSWKLTDGNKANILLLGLIAAVVTIAGACACGLGILVALPVTTIAWSYAYLRLSGQPVAVPARVP